MEIEKVYSEFLDSKRDEYKEKYKGLEKFFSASSAGHCYKKHLFKITDAPQKDIEARSQRILRLGTLIHQDFEDAVKYYISNQNLHATSTNGDGITSTYYFDNYKFYVEHQIRLPQYNIVGHLDFAVFDKDNRQLTIYDYKTAASYKWSLKFGRKYKDKNPNFNYEMQLSTYLLGMEFELGELDELIDNKQMSIVWYNKDTSRMREEKIDLPFIDVAIDYWQELNTWRDEIENANPELDNYDIVNLTLSRHREIGVPFQDWECKYCPYDHICK